MTLPDSTRLLVAPVAVRHDFAVLRARFVTRPNRFLVLARLEAPGHIADGEVVRVHCPDPGRLRELLIPDALLYVSEAAPHPTRRTQFDLRFVEHVLPPEDNEAPAAIPQTTLVSLDTRLPNRLIEAALQTGALSLGAAPYRFRAEVPTPIAAGGQVRSRFDFVVTCADGTECWVEVKSVTLVENGVALFPDAPTVRGARHVEELAHIVQRGLGRGLVIFVIQRTDASAVAAHRQRDPHFAASLDRAYAAGVEVYGLTCSLQPDWIRLERQVPVQL